MENNGTHYMYMGDTWQIMGTPWNTNISGNKHEQESINPWECWKQTMAQKQNQWGVEPTWRPGNHPGVDRSRLG